MNLPDRCLLSAGQQVLHAWSHDFRAPPSLLNVLWINVTLRFVVNAAISFFFFFCISMNSKILWEIIAIMLMTFWLVSLRNSVGWKTLINPSQLVSCTLKNNISLTWSRCLLYNEPFWFLQPLSAPYCTNENWNLIVACSLNASVWEPCCASLCLVSARWPIVIVIVTAVRTNLKKQYFSLFV